MSFTRPTSASRPFPFTMPAYMTNVEPTKYVKIDGVTQINPKWKQYQESHGKPTTSALYPSQALVVISSMEQHEQLRIVSKSSGHGDVPLSAATDSTIEMMQQVEMYKRVGLSPDAIVDALCKIFVKHEVPMGMMNKLMDLINYDELEFIMDDSSSMRDSSNAKDAQGRPQTRWEEANSRMLEMIEVMAYVPIPKLTIRYFNRKDVISFQRSGETPENFMNTVGGQVKKIAASLPSGNTPARERLEESFERGIGKRISRYFFCDGQPNGGNAARKSIAEMIKNRAKPQENPLTFLSCSDQDADVEWMKETEELAPYCAEYDDFEDEAREVHRDQGEVLPYTKGFHLIGQLVGAMNPDDLDAMDESIPLTKWTLDNIMGVQTTDQEYRRYYEGFQKAQRNRKIESPMDKIKANFNWEAAFSDFVRKKSSDSINLAQDFKRQLEHA